jgi:hypothetical protein
LAARESDAYVDRPVDDILTSAAFDETQPFGREITELLDQRKRAVEAGDETTRRRVEKDLLRRNPGYFSYLEIEKHLRAVGGGGR